MEKIGLISTRECEVPDQISCRSTKKIQTHKVGQNGIEVIVSGIGQKNVIGSTKTLCQEYSPDFIIFLGFCGGIMKNCMVCNLFIADKIHYDGNEISLDSQRLNHVKKIVSKSQNTPFVGNFQTFDTPVLSKTDVVNDVNGVEFGL